MANNRKGKATPPPKKERTTLKQDAFIAELLADEDMNATAAYQRVFKCSLKAAESGASRLLSQAKVQAALKIAQDERAERTKVTADKVLTYLWEIATADANSLSEVRRVCCRHCYGKNFNFQWKNADEFKRATENAIAEAKESESEPRLPNDDGGYGFNPTLHPHPHCPECFGEGKMEPHFHDTRHLKGAARKLYAGVKTTQHGIEIKTRDQDAALNSVARHLGMFNDKLTLKGDAENPLLTLIQSISGPSATLKPVSDDEGGQ